MISSAIAGVTAPNTNVSWPIGANRSITWSPNLGDVETVKIEVSRDSDSASPGHMDAERVRDRITAM
jgi:hypothetical protein